MSRSSWRARSTARAPDKLYFFGGSEGGREGLTMAQRYPNDFDGIVSVRAGDQLGGAAICRDTRRACCRWTGAGRRRAR